jgi:methylmalonyl-CoA mutase cobalamin-binding subunit
LFPTWFAKKLIVEIDRIASKADGDFKRFLLFLPEGELHELGILFMFYLLRKNGHQVLYFGQSTPLDSVVEAARTWQADFIALSLVNPMAIPELETYLHDLVRRFPNQQILINGYQTQFLDPENYPELLILNDFEVLTTWLSAL